VLLQDGVGVLLPEHEVVDELLLVANLGLLLRLLGGLLLVYALEPLFPLLGEDVLQLQGSVGGPVPVLGRLLLHPHRVRSSIPDLKVGSRFGKMMLILPETDLCPQHCQHVRALI
jgi:hypothetical protein